MSLREWLILIGILVVVGVFVDGYRRMRLARRRLSEISFGLEEVRGNDDAFSSELPNGGARPSSLKEGGAQKSPAMPRIEPSFSRWDHSEGYPDGGEREPPVYPESLKQRHVAEEAELHAKERSAKDSVAGEITRDKGVLDLDESAPVITSFDGAQKSSKRLLSVDDNSPVEGFSRADGSNRSVHSRETSRLDVESEEFVGCPRVVARQDKAPIKERDVSARESSNLQNELGLGGDEKAEKLKDRPPASEVIVINVLSKGGSFFTGDQLMQSILASGMCFGDMSIFHRYTNADGTGKILFSMANGVKPGTFTIDHLEATETPVLSLFMSLPGPEKPMQAFALMEETARRFALDLGGELKDEHFSVMTQQTIEHCRHRIREYERKQLAKHPVY